MEAAGKAIVMMAAHDDGFGATTTLMRLAFALLDEYAELEITFLNSRAESIVKKAESERKGIKHRRTENLIEIPKDSHIGGVDVQGLLASLSDKDIEIRIEAALSTNLLDTFVNPDVRKWVLPDYALFY